jgi:cytochrome c oxidase assembly factor CtaG
MTAPSTQALLTDWSWEPSVLIGLALLSAGYAYLVGPFRERRDLGPPVTRTQVTMFVLAMLTLVLALLSPLDGIGDTYLFSAHMVQHLMLASLFPPLFLAALPAWLVRPLFRRPGAAAFLGFFTMPAMALILFNANIYLWHLPALYDLTLRNEQIHVLEHLSFMAFGVLNWWPVLSPIPEQRLAYPLQVLYLFADGMLMMVLGILFTFAPTVFYPPYAAAPRLWGISPLSDQQLGGLIMWYPGNLPYGVFLVIAFYRWFEGEEQGMQTPSPTIGPPAGAG